MLNLIYEILLTVHSFTRWWVLLASLLTAIHALLAARTGRGWGPRDQRVARTFVASVDLQVLLGLALYFGVSPLARAARAEWAADGVAALWAEPLLRFFGLLHPALALGAALAAHAAWVRVRQTDAAPERHRRLASGAALSLALFLAAIPWPFLGHERPWLRF